MGTTNQGIFAQEGSIGQLTFYTKEGKVIVRKRHNLITNKRRTAKSMTQRTKMSNLSALWRAFDGVLRGCFENKKAGATDYSGYMAINARTARVFLSKEQAEAHYGVADGIAVSHGTLEPVVQVVEQGEWFLSDILCDELAWGAPQTVQELWSTIEASNPDRFRKGDELLFVRMNQCVNPVKNMPYVLATSARLPFVEGRDVPLDRFFANQGGGDGFRVRDGRLCAERREGTLVAWIHRRPYTKDRMLVTTQNLVGVNPLLAAFTSEAAWLRAITSYGPVRGLPHKRKNHGTGQQDGGRLPETGHAPSLHGPHSDTSSGGDALTISLLASPAGAGSVLGGGTCLKGTELHLSAQAAPGYRFLAWEDGCTDASRVLKAEKSDTLTAFFIRNQ